ncbi:hypothetical protein TIFTF001_031526 [Ficus carica]|uniref:Uncharacterized protein n=1 Tax=Ficus carica TaxID=3494 RepID=A0AA88J5K7_FICCA|nr:hypothetical protein TIFTF001_031526 [Ficus carica]
MMQIKLNNLIQKFQQEDLDVLINEDDKDWSTSSRFLFRIKQWVEVKYTKVSLFLAGFASFGIRASVLVSEFSVVFTIDLSNGFPLPFVVSSLYRGLVILGGVRIIWYQSFGSSLRFAYPI